MPSEQIPEPWRSFLSEIDKNLKEKVELYCLGGFVVTTLYGLVRSTADVDVITIAPRSVGQHLLGMAGKGSKLHRKYGMYLDFVTVAAIPEDYDQRLTEMFPGAFEHLRLLAFDPYDIALAKLERNIQRDRDDVKYLARTVPFDLDVLRDRYEKELRPILGNPDREDLTLQLWREAIEEERSRQPKD
jgi:Nucleotidyltransferase of unknown function (DUF6036)/Acetohydroxy acid isomeroreductase, NADPH-binding domain